MKFIKGGIAVKIKVISGKKYSYNTLNKYFDISLYDQINNIYYLKENILNKNIKSYREEIMNIIPKEADSLSNSESYILGTSIDKLLNSKINLFNDNEKYFFDKYKNISFFTDNCICKIDNIVVEINIITIIWPIDKISLENADFLITFLNSLIRNSLKNRLKDITWFMLTD